MTESAIVQAVFFSSVFVLFGVFSWMPVTRGPLDLRPAASAAPDNADAVGDPVHADTTNKEQA